MSKSVAALVIISSLAGVGLQASSWDSPTDRSASDWEEPFLAPKTEYGAGHRGVDFKLATGSPINAPMSGLLVFKGLVVDRDVVTIRSADGYLASFEPACTNFEVGDRVKPGQEIAWHCMPSAEYEYHCPSCVHYSTSLNLIITGSWDSYVKIWDPRMSVPVSSFDQHDKV
jgi:hypothetical protein